MSLPIPDPETWSKFKPGDLVRGDRENASDQPCFLTPDNCRVNIGVTIKHDEVYMVLGGIKRTKDSDARLYLVLTSHGVFLTAALFLEKVK